MPPADEEVLSRVDDLLDKLAGGGTSGLVDDLGQLSEIVESAEARYQDVVGDTRLSPNNRNQHLVGRVLAVVKDYDDVFDALHGKLVEQPADWSLRHRVAVLRFFLATLSCWQDQHPLKDQQFVEGLQVWVQESWETQDPPTVTEDSLLREQHTVYATGLLAIALSNPELAGEAVRSSLLPKFIRYLKYALSNSKDSSEGSPKGSKVGAAKGAHKGCPPEEEGPLQARASCLRCLKRRFCIQCLAGLGEYVECLGPLLQEQGVDVVVGLLRQYANDGRVLMEVLHLASALLAHRKFAELMINKDGVKLLLSVQQSQFTQGALAMCLFALASTPLAFERVCCLQSPGPAQITSTALSLLNSGYDPARKYAALFFGAAINYPAILREFDAQDSLRALLNVLRATILLLQGHHPHTDLRPEKQVAFNAAHALRQYFRTHFVLHVMSMKRRTGGPSHGKVVRVAAHRGIDISQETMEQEIKAVENDPRLGEAFIQGKWAVLDKFMEYGGVTLLLDLVQVAPGERYFHDTALYALEMLYLITMSPVARATGFLFLTHSGEGGVMAVLLSAIAGLSSYGDHEVVQAALLVMCNLVAVPSSLSHLLPPLEAKGVSARCAQRNAHAVSASDAVPKPGSSSGAQASAGPSSCGDKASCSNPTGAGVSWQHSAMGKVLQSSYQAARGSLRSRNGIKVLLSLLQARNTIPAGCVLKVRSLVCRCLLGLLRDPTIRVMLTKLQLGRLLAELIKEPHSLLNQKRGHASPGSSIGGASTHDTFNKYALELITYTTSPGIGGAGAAACNDAATPALQKIERAAIASATHITYPTEDLLQLLHDHLKVCGLHHSADMLALEARLAGKGKLQSTGKGEVTPHHCVHQPSGKKRQLTVSPNLLQTPGTGSRWSARSQPSSSVARQTVAAKEGSLGHCSVERVAARGTKRPAGDLQSPQLPPALRGSRTCTGCEACPSARRGGPEADDSQGCAHASQACCETRCSKEMGNCGLVASDVDMLVTKNLAVGAGEEHFLHGRMELDGFNASTTNVEAPFLAEEMPRSISSPDAGTSTRKDRSQDENPLLADLPGTMWGGRKKTVRVHGLAEVPRHVQACASEFPSGPNVSSKLNTIVMSYLKHQHRQLCMQSDNPITVIPPLSLLTSRGLPQPKRSLDAPVNAVSRHSRMQAGQRHGGLFGGRATRHHVYSRFCWRRMLKEEGPQLLTCCSFVRGWVNLIAGTHMGELRMYEHGMDTADVYPGHASAVQLIDTMVVGEAGMVATSSRSDVMLWNVDRMEDGCLSEFHNVRSGRFNRAGSQLACIGNLPHSSKVVIYDVATSQELVLEEAVDGTACKSLSKNVNGVSFSPSDELLVWGNTLWDPRAPRAIHTFDQFTDYCGGCFHPSGLELIMNSEIWDLRTYQLMRSVPLLDGSRVTFNSSGDVIYSIMQRSPDDFGGLNNTRRLRHPLHSAFRTVDAIDYQEIATVQVERCVLDLAVDPYDQYSAVLTMDMGDVRTTALRVYEVGRQKPAEDDSELDEDDDAEEEEDRDTDVGDPEDDEDDEDDDGNEEEDDGDEDEEDGLSLRREWGEEGDSVLDSESGYSDASSVSQRDLEEEDQDFEAEMVSMLLDLDRRREEGDSDEGASVDDSDGLSDGY